MFEILQIIVRVAWIVGLIYLTAFVAGFWLPVRIKFERRDWWIGVFFDRREWFYGPSHYRIYICILPTLPIVITIRIPEKWSALRTGAEFSRRLLKFPKHVEGEWIDPDMLKRGMAKQSDWPAPPSKPGLMMPTERVIEELKSHEVKDARPATQDEIDGSQVLGRGWRTGYHIDEQA